MIYVFYVLYFLVQEREQKNAEREEKNRDTNLNFWQTTANKRGAWKPTVIKSKPEP